MSLAAQESKSDLRKAKVLYIEARRNLQIAITTPPSMKVESFVSWEQQERSISGGCHHNHDCGLSSWFFVRDNEVWSLNSDSSDGGCWNSKGPLVSGYKSAMTKCIMNALEELDSRREVLDAAELKFRAESYGYERKRMK
ncbi:hypothetical protein [Shewanella sp. UCD-KL12]|uniref:hypothetical protein n=1 Tax=Shewanella sp. UCD-KL12 TaxID=1917163 RepID=UPI0009706344|nr:hypothetical protein [Shewanella sp. UCD-KL12]